MEPDSVKVLLEMQERTFRSAMNIVTDELKERIRIVENTMSDVIKSLEFSQAEVRDLKSESAALRKSDVENQTIIGSLETRVAELEQRVNHQEDYSRRSNLRITGIKEEGNESWEKTATTVTAMLQDKLQLPDVKLERAHRVGPRSLLYPRPIVARFERFSDREAAIRNSRKLKGTGIFINEDLCPASMEIKKKQLPAMKKAREEGKIAFFRRTRLVIRERTVQTTTSSVTPAAVPPSQGDSPATSDGEGVSAETPLLTTSGVAREDNAEMPGVEAAASLGQASGFAWGPSRADAGVVRGGGSDDGAGSAATHPPPADATRAPSRDAAAPATSYNTRSNVAREEDAEMLGAEATASPRPPRTGGVGGPAATHTTSRKSRKGKNTQS